MAGIYKSLTDFLPILEDDKIGDWAIDRVNDRTVTVVFWRLTALSGGWIPCLLKTCP